MVGYTHCSTAFRPTVCVAMAAFVLGFRTVVGGAASRTQFVAESNRHIVGSQGFCCERPGTSREGSLPCQERFCPAIFRPYGLVLGSRTICAWRAHERRLATDGAHVVPPFRGPALAVRAMLALVARLPAVSVSTPGHGKASEPVRSRTVDQPAKGALPPGLSQHPAACYFDRAANAKR